MGGGGGGPPPPPPPPPPAPPPPWGALGTFRRVERVICRVKPGQDVGAAAKNSLNKGGGGTPICRLKGIAISFNKAKLEKTFVDPAHASVEGRSTDQVQRQEAGRALQEHRSVVNDEYHADQNSLTLAGGLAGSSAGSADACTSMIFKAEDGTRIYARTMEWGASDLKSGIYY